MPHINRKVELARFCKVSCNLLEATNKKWRQVNEMACRKSTGNTLTRMHNRVCVTLVYYMHGNVREQWMCLGHTHITLCNPYYYTYGNNLIPITALDNV